MYTYMVKLDQRLAVIHSQNDLKVDEVLSFLTHEWGLSKYGKSKLELLHSFNDLNDVKTNELQLVYYYQEKYNINCVYHCDYDLQLERRKIWNEHCENTFNYYKNKGVS